MQDVNALRTGFFALTAGFEQRVAQQHRVTYAHPDRHDNIIPHDAGNDDPHVGDDACITARTSVKRAEASVPLLVFRYPDADQISWLLHPQYKMVLVEIEDSILFHFSKLQRQAAALNAEIIRELLP